MTSQRLPFMIGCAAVAVIGIGLTAIHFSQRPEKNQELTMCTGPNEIRLLQNAPDEFDSISVAAANFFKETYADESGNPAERDIIALFLWVDDDPEPAYSANLHVNEYVTYRGYKFTLTEVGPIDLGGPYTNNYACVRIEKETP